MDLIYTDNNGIEKEVINTFELDLSYGDSENDFQLTIPLDMHCMDKDYRIHVTQTKGGKEKGTEYGGIVDEISPDKTNNTVTYKGRTWHGVMNNHVIEPEVGYDYLLLDGDANVMLKELIDNMSLAGLFEVSQEMSGIEIQAYEMERYISGYTGICKMLADHNAKLKMEYANQKVLLSAVPLVDYSEDEEFDTDQVDFKVKRKYNTTNHIICAGQGDLAERYVIHLFTDENGGVQPYAYTNTPLQDSDYILDKSQQLLYGPAELCIFKNFNKAEVTKNHILLVAQPANWHKEYSGYYLYDAENDRYKEVEGVKTNTYTLLAAQPSDWVTNFGNYFEKNSNATSGYSAVEAEETSSYKKLTKRPKDWKKNYGNYYYKFSDGVTTEYLKVAGRITYEYKKQTKRPSDWEENYTSYYKRKKEGGFETVPRSENKKVPKWEKGRYFTRYSETKAPVFKNKTYYSVTVSETAPAYSSGKYYSNVEIVNAPPFVKNKYYKQVLDHYAVMVADTLEEIQKEILDCDTIDVDLKPNQEYDIGDMIGATERITGITVIQPITQKIVKISNNTLSPTITYEVGRK